MSRILCQRTHHKIPCRSRIQYRTGCPRRHLCLMPGRIRGVFKVQSIMGINSIRKILVLDMISMHSIMPHHTTNLVTFLLEASIHMRNRTGILPTCHLWTNLDQVCLLVAPDAIDPMRQGWVANGKDPITRKVQKRVPRTNLLSSAFRTNPLPTKVRGLRT